MYFVLFSLVYISYVACATNGIWYTLIAICIGMPCLMSCGYRSKLRAKFGLVESPAPDCLVHCFCDYCALCQEYRELYARGLDPSIGMYILSVQKPLVTRDYLINLVMWDEFLTLPTDKQKPLVGIEWMTNIRLKRMVGIL